MWQPRGKQQEILDRAWRWRQSVPYEVSSRWLFYKLYDKDHLYACNKKSAYKNLFLPLLSKARKRFYGNWQPDSLIDDTREEILTGGGYIDERGWLRGMASRECHLDKWQYAKYYVEIWFEARAMKGQFGYYAPNINLVPFGGDASIEYKWRIAKRLEAVSERYDGIPIKILYFGDADKKGGEIPDNALRDIRAWCSADFDFIHCGLTVEQAKELGLGEDMDRQGSYQWESLSDEEAEDIIVSNAERFVSHGEFTEVEALEQEATARFREAIKGLFGG
ncbi:hypothetical protein ES708_01411 [subsurface metagenome]